MNNRFLPLLTDGPGGPGLPTHLFEDCFHIPEESLRELHHLSTAEQLLNARLAR